MQLVELLWSLIDKEVGYGSYFLRVKKLGTYLLASVTQLYATTYHYIYCNNKMLLTVKVNEYP